MKIIFLTKKKKIKIIKILRTLLDYGDKDSGVLNISKALYSSICTEMLREIGIDVYWNFIEYMNKKEEN